MTYVSACAYFILINDKNGDIQSEYQSSFKTLTNTFLSSIYYGIRTPGGIGAYVGYLDAEDPNYYARFVIDILYFLFIHIILSSLLWAVVFESYFVFKKHLLNEKHDKNNETCFLCHQNIIQLKNIGEDWKTHFKERHNLKTYFYFFLYLNLNQDLYQFGNSKLIKQMVDKKDFSFMPKFGIKL